MSRSNQPQRPSDYTKSVFMHELPENAEQEAGEMARRHGVDEPRKPAAKKPKPKPKPKPAAQNE